MTASRRGDRGKGWEVVEPFKGRKSPWLAGALSFIWPGLGHFYTGRWAKGFLLLFGQLANLVLLFATVGFFSVPLLWFWGIVDAASGASRAQPKTATALVGRAGTGD